jgi:hypothetical protein
VSTRGPSLLANKWTWHWKKPKVGLSNAIGLSDFLFAESDLYYHYILTISKAGLWWYQLNMSHFIKCLIKN